MVDENNQRILDAALFRATRDGNHLEVTRLLDLGANVNAIEDEGRFTPGHIAAASGNKNLVVLFLERGALIEAKDIEGKTMLHLSVLRYQYDVFDLLLKKGANINARDYFNNSVAQLSLNDRGEVDYINFITNPDMDMEQKEFLASNRYIRSYASEYLLEETKRDGRKARIHHAPKKDDLGKECEAAPYLLCAHVVMKAAAISKFLGAGDSFTRSLVRNMSGTWQKMSDSLLGYDLDACRNVSDTINEATRYVLSPELVRTLSDGDREKITDRILTAIEGKMSPVVAETFFAEKGADKVLGISSEWHRKRHNLTTTGVLRNFALQGQWASLFADGEVIKLPESIKKGWSLVNLTNSEQLDDEGRLLRHCVASYSPQCLSGESHIVSIRNHNSEPVSTIEFCFNQDKLAVRQHHSEYDDPPPAASQKAEDWFVNEVGKGAIKLNDGPFGRIFGGRFLSPIENAVGWKKEDLTDEVVDKMFRILCGKEGVSMHAEHSRRSYLIPRQFTHGTWDDFMNQSGLRKKLWEVVKAEVPDITVPELPAAAKAEPSTRRHR